MSEDTGVIDERADDEFERLGRRAGAELRTPPPADGPGIVQRTVKRRRRMVAGVAGAAVAIIVTGLLVQREQPTDDNEKTVASAPAVTQTTSDPTATTVPPDGGTWRDVPNSTFAPASVAAAVWTGHEAIVFGDDGQGVAAAAYEATGDRWRDVADPPAALNGVMGRGQTPQWTGSEVLAATSDGHVFAYNPGEDRWKPRASPDESMGFSSGSVFAVSARGVLARSSAGWWWYDYAADRWEELSAPALDEDKTTLAALDDHRMVATEIDGSTLTSSVLDTQTQTWADGPSVQGPVNPREMECSAANGLLVCLAEGYGSAAGEVIDPLVGSVGTFALGAHSSTINAYGTPWFAHAGKILLARPDPAWEDLPPQGATGSFGAAVWTGSEVVFFGSGLGTTAAYTPRSAPSGERP